jgi:hypothetical protein
VAELWTVRAASLSCPFSRVPDVKFHSVLFLPVDFSGVVQKVAVPVTSEIDKAAPVKGFQF